MSRKFQQKETGEQAAKKIEERLPNLFEALTDSLNALCVGQSLLDEHHVHLADGERSTLSWVGIIQPVSSIYNSALSLLPAGITSHFPAVDKVCNALTARALTKNTLATLGAGRGDGAECGPVPADDAANPPEQIGEGEDRRHGSSAHTADSRLTGMQAAEEIRTRLPGLFGQLLCTLTIFTTVRALLAHHGVRLTNSESDELEDESVMTPVAGCFVHACNLLPAALLARFPEPGEVCDALNRMAANDLHAWRKHVGEE